MKALKVIVLLVSISAASVLVWNAARDQKSKQVEEKGVITPKKMQGSSKMKVVVTADIIESMDSDSKVIDEEVKAMRDALLSTSKSGRIMSDDKIREMLEKKEKLKAEMVVESKPHLMSSSKSGPAMTFDELLKFMEAKPKASPKDDAENHEILMHSSKSFSGPIFKPKELEKIVEGDKKEDGLLHPQESDK
jgi:hypothetical protein